MLPNKTQSKLTTHVTDNNTRQSAPQTSLDVQMPFFVVHLLTTWVGWTYIHIHSFTNADKLKSADMALSQTIDVPLVGPFDMVMQLFALAKLTPYLTLHSFVPAISHNYAWT